MWKKRDLQAAKQHFSEALSSGKARAYVRQLQSAALWNGHSDDCEFELIRVVNEMRKNGESIDPLTKSHIWFVYVEHFSIFSGKFSNDLLAAVPPADQLATFHWLFHDSDFDQSKVLTREYYIGMLEEATGQTAEALKTFQAARSKAVSAGNLEIRDMIDAAIKRLSRNSPRNLPHG